jgi:hypothetical protein
MTFYTKELSVYLKAKKKKDSLTNTSLKWQERIVMPWKVWGKETNWESESEISLPWGEGLPYFSPSPFTYLNIVLCITWVETRRRNDKCYS